MRYELRDTRGRSSRAKRPTAAQSRDLLFGISTDQQIPPLRDCCAVAPVGMTTFSYLVSRVAFLAAYS
jgi:hypothetical protein